MLANFIDAKLEFHFPAGQSDSWVLGAQFLEFLRKRLIVLRELLAADGSIFVHLDWKKGHYLKAIMDEIFGEENFRNEVIWKRTTANAAMAGALLTIPISTVLKFLPVWTNGAFPDYPFLDRMSITFVSIVLVMIAMSLINPRKESDTHVIEVDTSMFRITTGFAIGSIIIMGILLALYTVFW